MNNLKDFSIEIEWRQIEGISRPGMIIKCSGEIWPGEKIYKDE